MKLLLTVLLCMPFLSLASINLETQNQLGSGDPDEPFIPYIKLEVQKLSYGTGLPNDVTDLPFIRPVDDPYDPVFPEPLTVLDKKAKEAAVDFCINDAEGMQNDCIQLLTSRIEQCGRAESFQATIKFFSRDDYLTKLLDAYDSQIKCLNRSGFLIEKMEMAVRPWDPDAWPYLLVPELPPPLEDPSEDLDDDDDKDLSSLHTAPLEYASKDDDEEIVPFLEPRPELIKPCSPDGHGAGPNSGSGLGSGGGGPAFGDSYDGPCFF